MSKKYAIAVDLGATSIRVALGDDKGNILIKVKEKTGTQTSEAKSDATKKEGRKEIIAEQILRLVRLVIDLSKKKVKIEGVGIGSIGPLDLKKKAIVNSPNVPFKFIPLKSVKKLKRPVFLLNDCQAAVLGEKYFGAGRGINNLVYITMSSGIGGGAMVDGHLLFGEKGNAVEIGHLIVDTTYNLLCGCRKGRGHWEGYASGENIPRFFKVWLKENRIKKVGFKYSSAKDIFEAAKKRNKIASRFIGELGRINARAISNIIVAYNPSLITMGGSVALNNKNLILKSIKRDVDHFLKVPKIKITPLGDNAVLYGALAEVFGKEGFRL